MTNLDFLAVDELPNGWAKVSLALFRQQTTSSFNPAAYGTSSFELYSVPSHETGRPEVVLGSTIGSNKQYVSPGDVLISKINPRLNRAWVVGNVTDYPKIASTEWIVFKQSNAIDSHLLCYILQSFRIRDFLAHNASGVGGSLTRAKPSLVDQISIGLPPVAEQLRIVAKIEELFSELDKGIESLKTAQAQLKVYRQALLKHAFEGKLTAQWRADNPDKLETADALLKRIQKEREQRYQQQVAEWETAGKPGSKPKAPKPLTSISEEEAENLPSIPQGWVWTRMIESCETVVDCHNKTAPYQASGIPLVRTSCIRDMQLNFDEEIRYISEDTYRYWSRRCPPLPGDILFTREAPMGEAAIIPEGKRVCMGQRIMLLRPGKLLSAKYLLCATQAPFFKAISNKVAVGTGVKHLRVGDVERLIFPICSIQEQAQISDQLDAKLSELDQLNQTITASIQQSDALRQSILKKAFSGQLVPQDPVDEPASVLLARIRAERERAVSPDRQTKKGSKLLPHC